MKNSDNIVRKEPTKVPSKEIQEYWTSERMASAKPLPLPTLKGKEFPKEEIKTRGPVLRSGKKRTKNRNANIESVGNPLDYPYCCCGQLWITSNGNDFAASASVIDSHIILTAAHCLYDKKEFGGWADSILFFPDSPYSSLPGFASSGDWTIFKEWMDYGDFPYDMGMIRVADDMLSTMCGCLGWVYNYKEFHPMECVGYPWLPNPPYNGVDMYSVIGGTYLSATYPGMVYMDNNDMNGGESGAPWLAWVAGGGQYVNGVASCRVFYESGDSLLMSPVFDEKFQRLWNSAQT